MNDMDEFSTPDSDEVLSYQEMERDLETANKKLEVLCSQVKGVYEKKLRESLKNAAPFTGKNKP